MSHAIRDFAPAPRIATTVRSKLWIDRIVSGVAVLFLVMDGGMKLFKPAPVVDAFAQLGVPVSQSVGIGLVLLACTAIYAIPRTAVIGAILLTGYLGGAIAIQLRVEAPVFSIVFPLIFAALVWGGLYRRDERVRSLLTPRR
ncbi:MAG: DoxX family protein [bacterium]